MFFCAMPMLMFGAGATAMMTGATMAIGAAATAAGCAADMMCGGGYSRSVRDDYRERERRAERDANRAVNDVLRGADV